MTTTIELTEQLTKELEALRNNQPIEELVVILISAEEADNMAKVCIKLRDERFYVAYANNPTKPISVLWSDMNFIRKSFGLERYNGKSSTTSPVTFESLNYGRKQNLADYKKAIELNVHYNELSNLLPDGSFGTYKSKDEYGREIEVQRTPNRLTRACKAGYEREIAYGLYVVCKFVGEVELGFSV